jgi:formylglycine-generating enzyme required for sulfatase activity
LAVAAPQAAARAPQAPPAQTPRAAPQPTGPQEANDAVAARIRALQRELPARLDQDAHQLLPWVKSQVLPEVGPVHAERLLWALLNPECTVEDLGKLWLALEAIGRPPRREDFFKRAKRPLDDLPHIEFVAVPAGTFTMGSPAGEPGRSDAEGPQRTVAVAAFELAATPVTNAQFAVFDPLHAPQPWPGVPEEEVADHPVVRVSWWDAFVFCRWLGARLPSEAEWEYACRAGKPTRFWSGDAVADLARVGWFFDNAEHRLHRVGAKPANPFGLFDMHGNVFEWCADSWHDSYAGAPTTAAAWIELAVPRRVYRGGAWIYYAEYARCAFRGGWMPAERNSYTGFRPARDP